MQLRYGQKLEKPDVDVAIVGLGPIGATLAALLGLQGLSVLVLERETDIYDLPRAVHFDDETMRVFQRVGIADQLKEKIIINPGTRFVDRDGKVLVDWPRRKMITENGWHCKLSISPAGSRSRAPREARYAGGRACQAWPSGREDRRPRLPCSDRSSGQAR